MPREKRPPISRFWPKVKCTPDRDDCWEWQGAIDPKTGYGRFGMGGRKDGVVGAHQFSYWQRYEFTEEGNEICHKCNNRKCVNPDHLYEGTRQENMDQAKADGRLVREFKPWSETRRKKFDEKRVR